MPEEQLQTAPSNGGGNSQPESSGSSGNFSVSAFMKEAAEIPTIENPEYNDEELDRPQDPNAVVPTPEETARKRTLPEIQQHRSAQAKARKFDGLTEDEAKLFMEMSQRAYEYLYPKFTAKQADDKQRADLQEQLRLAQEKRWYEEPDAYTLHPEYKEISKSLSMLGQEEDFWKEQLEKLEAGQPINDLTFDSKTGEYMYGQQIQPSPRVKAQVIANLTKLAQGKLALQGDFDKLKGGFVERQKKISEGINVLDKEMFGELDFDKVPALKSSFDTWLNRVPKELQSTPVYRLLAKQAALVENLNRILRSKEAAAAPQKAIKATMQNAGPGNGSAGGGGGPSADALDRGFGRMTRQRLS